MVVVWVVVMWVYEEGRWMLDSKDKVWKKEEGEGWRDGEKN